MAHHDGRKYLRKLNEDGRMVLRAEPEILFAVFDTVTIKFPCGKEVTSPVHAIVTEHYQGQKYNIVNLKHEEGGYTPILQLLPTKH